MADIISIIEEFTKQGGILKTSELHALGLSSRQIKRLLDEGEISKIKQGYYELADEVNPEEIIIAKLFPEAVIFLERKAWQIAVDRNSEKSKYKIDYPLIEPYYQDPKYLNIGVSTFQVQGFDIRIFDRDRTMCDIMRYEKKIEKEVFTKAVMRYIKDPRKNIRHLFEYAEVFNITKKVQSQIGKWL